MDGRRRRTDALAIHAPAPARRRAAHRCNAQPLRLPRNVGVQRDDAAVGGRGDERARMADGSRQGHHRLLGPAQEDFITRRLVQRFEPHRMPGHAARCRRRTPLRGQRGVAAMQVVHHGTPHGRRTGHARHVPHRVAVRVADPHADAVAAREADAPVVAHVLAGARLHRGPVACSQRVVEAEGGHPRFAVGQDVGHDEAGCRIHDLHRRGHPVAGQRPPGRPCTSVRQCTVCVGQRCQRHLR